MKYARTLRELSNRYDWKKVCAVMGLSYWCLNEGADGDSIIWLTENEALNCGIID